MEELRPMEGTPRGQQHLKEEAEEMSLKVKPRGRGMKLARSTLEELKAEGISRKPNEPFTLNSKLEIKPR